MIAVVASLVLALSTSLALTPLVRQVACRRGWIAKPRDDRWADRPVALMGGIAIAGGAWLGAAVAAPSYQLPHWALLAAATVMFLVGLVDDRVHLKPHTKLIAQLVAAVALVQAGYRFGFGHGVVEHLDQAFTILFLVAVANAFNLLDNMDGLCAGIAAITALVLLVMQMIGGHVASAALMAALLGATLGFLRYNFSPASIFMGDCGSLFIGMFLGAASLLDPAPGQRQSVVSVLALPVLVLLIPLMDTTLVTVARQWNRRPVSQGGCDHSSHRLVAIGLSERNAVLFLYGLSLAGGLVALGVRYLDWYLGYALLPLFLLGILAVGLYLGQVRVYDEADTVGKLLDRTPIPIICQHRYRRRIAEVLIDSVCLAAGFYVANLLHYESGFASPHVQAVFRHAFPVVIATHLVAYFVVGVYRGLWRHTSVSDLPRFVKGATLGLLLTVAVLYMLQQLQGVSPAVLVINWLVQLQLLTGSRVSFKVVRNLLVGATADGRLPVLVVGLGEKAELVLRRMRMDPDWGLEPVGVVGEDPAAVGLQLHGTPVVGLCEEIRDVLAAHRVTQVILVDEAVSPEARQIVLRVCSELEIPTHTVKTVLCAVDEPAA